MRTYTRAYALAMLDCYNLNERSNVLATDWRGMFNMGGEL